MAAALTMREIMRDQIKRISALADQRREQMRETYKGLQLNQSRPTDAEVLEFVAKMQEQYPARQMVDPTGRPVFASPWFIYLGQVEDDRAEELVRRYIAITAGGE